MLYALISVIQRFAVLSQELPFVQIRADVNDILAFGPSTTSRATVKSCHSRSDESLSKETARNLRFSELDRTLMAERFTRLSLALLYTLLSVGSVQICAEKTTIKGVTCTA